MPQQRSSHFPFPLPLPLPLPHQPTQGDELYLTQGLYCEWGGGERLNTNVWASTNKEGGWEHT